MEQLNEIMQLFAQVTESTNSIYELTARVDERVKSVIERQNTADSKFNSLLEAHNGLMARIISLESKNYGLMQGEIDEIVKDHKVCFEDSLKADKIITDRILQLENRLFQLENSKKGLESKIGWIADILVKLFLVIIGCYISWKLGVSP